MKFTPYMIVDPEEKGNSLVRDFSDLGLSKKEAALAASLSIENLFSFMKDDDELYETTYWCNSVWTNYFIDVQKYIKQKYEI